MICGLAWVSSEDFRLLIGGNEIVKKGSLLSRGCADKGGGGGVRLKKSWCYGSLY